MATTPAFNPEGLRVFSWTKRDGDDPRLITPLIRMDTRYIDPYGPKQAIEQMKALPKGRRWVYLHALPDAHAGMYEDPVAWLLSKANECTVRAAALPFIKGLANNPPETLVVDVEFEPDPGDHRLGACLVAWQKEVPKLLPLYLRTAKWNTGERHILGAAIVHFVQDTRNKMLKSALAVKETLGCAFINYNDTAASNIGGFSSPSLYGTDRHPQWAFYVERCSRDIARVGPAKFIPWLDKTGGKFATVFRQMGCKTLFYFNAADGGSDYAAVDSTKLFLS